MTDENGRAEISLNETGYGLITVKAESSRYIGAEISITAEKPKPKETPTITITTTRTPTPIQLNMTSTQIEQPKRGYGYLPIIFIISAVIGYFSKGSAPETSTAPILTTPMVNNRNFETLSVKDSVIVQAAAVRVRQFPGLNTHINCEKHAGDKLQISGGPITVDGLRWWTVTSSNCTGWIAQKDKSGITLIARTE